MAAPTQKASDAIIITDKSRITNPRKSLLMIHDDNSHVAYYTALGGMLHMYSMIEQSIPWLMGCLSKTDSKTLRAIVYKQRVDSGIKSIKNVIAAKKMKGKRIREILQTLDHLSKINTLRNDILHLGARLTPNGRSIKITNDITAFGPSVKRTTTITIRNLEAMQHDLMLMSILWIDLDKSLRKKQPPEKARYAAESAKRIRAAIPLGAKIPWLYKPLVPKGPANRTKKRQAPKRPPLSSRV